MPTTAAARSAPSTPPSTLKIESGRPSVVDDTLPWSTTPFRRGLSVGWRPTRSTPLWPCYPQARRLDPLRPSPSARESSPSPTSLLPSYSFSLASAARFSPRPGNERPLDKRPLPVNWI
uniref:Uncharacterized protein n=1 Tax=Triticum urartu TaxID=4572 RepID=A0A8R7JZC0_TRIUA